MLLIFQFEKSELYKIWFLSRFCRELKRAGRIHSSWSSRGIVKLRCTMNKQPISIIHDSDIEDLYPNFSFREGQNQGKNK